MSDFYRTSYPIFPVFDHFGGSKFEKSVNHIILQFKNELFKFVRVYGWFILLSFN